jgi:hypothetical protein
MRRLAVLALIVTVLLAALVGLTRLISRTNKVTSFALIFTGPNGLPCAQPCMFGIRPGQTTFLDAVALLRAHPLTRDLRVTDSVERRGLVFSGDPFNVGLSCDDEGKLNMVDVQIGAAAPGDQAPPPSVFQSATFADMLLELGSPDYVAFGSATSGSIIESYYQALHLRIAHEARSELRINPNLPLLYVFMYIRSADITPELFPWMGFTSASRYTRAALSR